MTATESIDLDLDALAETIEADVLEAKRRKIKVFPRYVLGSYDIGDDCERYLYHTIANWQDRKLHDARKQALFDEGDVLAEASMTDLRAAGYKIRNEEKTYEVSCRNGVITGHVDWWISGGVLGEREVVFEHKGLSYGQEEAWDSWRDMLRAKARWVRRYPGQMQMYLYQTWQDSPDRDVLDHFGFFGVRGKESAVLSLKAVEFDLDFSEGLLQKGERVYTALIAKEPPARIPYDPRMCDACDFAHICEPEKNIPIDERGIVLDEATELVMARYLELKPLATECADVEEVLKALGKAARRPALIVGKGVIEWEEQDRNFKAQPAKEAETKIVQTVKIRPREDLGNGGV